MNMAIFRRSTIIVTVVVALTDFIVFYALKARGRDLNTLTWKFILLVVIITLIPILLNFRVHFVIKK